MECSICINGVQCLDDTGIASWLRGDVASKRIGGLVGGLIIGLGGWEGRHGERGGVVWACVLGHYGLTKGVGRLRLWPGAEWVLLLLLRRLSKGRRSEIQQ